MTCPHCGQSFDPFPAFPSAAVNAIIEQVRIDAAAHQREAWLAAWERQRQEQVELLRMIRQAKAEQQALAEVNAWIAAHVKQ